MPTNTISVTPCCHYQVKQGFQYPVMWNPFNKVVQCHNCGRVYEPKQLAPQPAAADLAVPELAGTFPVVLYLPSREDVAELIAAVKLNKPGMVTRQL